MPLKGLSLTGHAGSRTRPKGLQVINTAPTTPGVAAAATLTPGAVPQNLRIVTNSNPALDGKFVWDGTPTTTALGTLVRYEMRAYLRAPSASIPAGTTEWICSDTQDDHQPPWTVQAVYSMGGMETASRPSNICMRAKIMTPYPSYLPTVLSAPPSWVAATPYWNEGAPLNHIQYNYGSEAQHSRVDRKIAGTADSTYITMGDGMFVLEYTDHSALPGVSYTYAVYKTIPQQSPSIYSPPALVTVTSLVAAPAATGPTPSNMTSYNYDGSVVLEFDAPFSYGDLRVHKASSPDQVKFAGINPRPSGRTLQNRPRIAIQMDVPVGGADYVAEFVDKPGPVNSMNLDVTSAAGQAMATMPTNTNGHGPPCFVPVPIGPAATFHCTGLPDANVFTRLTGDQSRGLSLSLHSSDFSFGPNIARSALTAEWQTVYDYNNNPGGTGDYTQFQLRESPSLYFGLYFQNTLDTSGFTMNRHGMDWGVEGGEPHTGGPAHNNNGASYFQIKQPFTLAAGEVLRFFTHVDGHSTGRDWIDGFIKAYLDPFLLPNKFFEFNRRPTVSGNLFRAEFLTGRTAMVFYPPTSPYAGSQSSDRSQSTGPNYTVNQLSNDTNQSALADFHLDLGQEIEVTLQWRASDGAVKSRIRNRTRYTNDLTASGGAANVGGFDQALIHDYDPLMVWPWWQVPSQQLCVAWEHLVYHLAIDAREESMDYLPHLFFNINRHPFSRQRHWHSFGYDILPVPTGSAAATFPA